MPKVLSSGIDIFVQMNNQKFSLERNPHSVSKCCQMTLLSLINRLIPIYHKTVRMFVKNCCTHLPFKSMTEVTLNESEIWLLNTTN